MQSLRSLGLVTPEAIPGLDGEVVQEVGIDGEGSRLASLFTWVDGVPLGQIDRLELWERLGELMAIVHQHGAAWPRPPGFTRLAWDVEGMIGDAAHWGDPRRLGRWSDDEDRLLATCQAGKSA